MLKKNYHNAALHALLATSYADFTFEINNYTTPPLLWPQCTKKSFQAHLYVLQLLRSIDTSVIIIFNSAYLSLMNYGEAFFALYFVPLTASFLSRGIL